MKGLENLVHELQSITSEKEIIQKLQSINTLLLTKYVLEIGDIKVIPLWIEAYYYDPKKFCDENTHRSPRQKNRMGMLYQHTHADTETNGGVDLCLSDGDYYLSFLIKASLIDGEFCKQERTYGKMSKTGLKLEELKDILICDSRACEVCHTQRIGLTKASYKDAPLASLPIDKIKNYPFDNKESLVKEYIDSLLSAERERKCIELLGYRSSFVLGK